MAPVLTEIPEVGWLSIQWALQKEGYNTILNSYVVRTKRKTKTLHFRTQSSDSPHARVIVKSPIKERETMASRPIDTTT